MPLNPRLTDFVAAKGDHYIWSAPDRKVRLPSFEAANAILDRIDAARRSPADYQLLARGVTNRRDDRTAEQKMSEIPAWHRQDYHTSSGNQARDSYDEIRGIFAPKKSALEQALDDFAREADEFDEAQAAPPAKEPNPKRLTQAAEHYLVSLYTDAPLTAFRQTEAMLAAAEINDGPTFSAIHREWSRAEVERIAAADAKLAAEQDRIAADRRALGDADFDETPATSPANNTQHEENTNANTL